MVAYRKMMRRMNMRNAAKKKSKFSTSQPNKSKKQYVALNIDPNKLDNDGYTPLHRAIEAGDADKAKDLLDKGANINTIIITNDWDEFTPLHLAANLGDSRIVKLLLDRGADSSILDDENRSAMDVAFDAQHLDTVSVIMEHPNSKIHFRPTPNNRYISPEEPFDEPIYDSITLANEDLKPESDYQPINLNAMNNAEIEAAFVVAKTRLLAQIHQCDNPLVKLAAEDVLTEIEKAIPTSTKNAMKKYIHILSNIETGLKSPEKFPFKEFGDTIASIIPVHQRGYAIANKMVTFLGILATALTATLPHTANIPQVGLIVAIGVTAIKALESTAKAYLNQKQEDKIHGELGKKMKGFKSAVDQTFHSPSFKKGG